MNIQSLIEKMTELSFVNEEKKETKSGIVHKAEPGGYGRKFDLDDDDGEEKKEKKPAVKRGRGRPKKGADSETGEVPQYAGAKALQSFMVGNIPKKGLPGKPGKKHKLKDWIEAVENKTILGEMQLTAPVPIISGGKSQQATITSTSSKPGDADVLKAAAAILKSGGGQIQMSPQAGGQPAQQTQQSKPVQTGATTTTSQTSSQPLREKELDEVAAPGQEEWIRKNKARFIDQYGKEKGLRVLYATAWKRSKADESNNKLRWVEPHKWGSEIDADPEAIQKHLKDFNPSVDKLEKEKDPWELEREKRKAGIVHSNESVTNDKNSVMESYTLEDVLSRYPHEHKMCQEGWGMDESLYEDLCEFYFKEGRIPRKIWHGSIEELRQHVEKCYEEDTRIITEEPLEENPLAAAGAVLGGVARAAAPIARTVAGGVADVAQAAAEPGLKGAATRFALSTAGNQISNALGGNSDEEETTESKLEQSLRQNVEEMENSMNNYDAKMENWERQLNTLLTEGVTITTSTGQKGIGDSVSVSATDGDAQQLMKLLQNSGLLSGRTGMQDQHDDVDAAVTVEPVAADEVLSSLAHHDEQDSGDTEMSFLKRMLGARGSEDTTSASDSHDYSSENDEDREESEKVDEEYAEEGNAYTGARQAAIKAGKDTFTVGDKTHKVTGDTSDEEKMDESEHDEEECEDCGMKESECECDHEHDEEHDDQKQGVAEGTDVTDYAPKSQGGTRKELLAKYQKTGDSKDAEAARKAGATQQELQAASKDLTEWANSPAGKSEDEQFQTEIEYMTKMISGGLNGMKRDQTVLPSTQVKTKL